MVAAASPRRVVIIGTGAAAETLASAYRGRGDDVVLKGLKDADALEAGGAELANGPIDLLLIIPDDAGETADDDGVDRTSLRNAVYQLTFLPFRLAALLRPAVRGAGGTIALVSRTSAAMSHPGGGFIVRPARAAAHALWRCLSVEWRGDGIRCVILALDDGDLPDDLNAAPGVIADAAAAEGYVTLIDLAGNPVSW